MAPVVSAIRRATTSEFVPCSKALGTPQLAGVREPPTPTYGPLLVLFPSLKRWGPPRRQGLCCQFAQMQATTHFVDVIPCFEALGRPQIAWVM